MISKSMKNIGILLTALFVLSACAKNPAVSFGKKCVAKGDKVYWSHVWIYDKNEGMDANKKDCELIASDKSGK